jgi:hypothetical protein
MHIISSDFESLNKVPVTALFGSIGVYVLWSSRADVRPSYVGEGNLAHRFANEHIGHLGKNVTGYTAIITEGTARNRKSDAEILARGRIIGDWVIVSTNARSTTIPRASVRASGGTTKRSMA